MSKKTTTKTNQQTHMVQTPNNPEFVSKGIEGLAGQVTDLSKADPYSFVAGPDALQTQAAQGASALSSSPVQGILNGVATAGPQSVQAASLLDNLPAYMSPYTKDVVDASLADYDFGAGQQDAQARLDLGGDTTFGGSGGALYRSALGGQLARGRGTLSAGLRDQAFNTGASLSGQDADRRQQASMSNASLAEQALARQAAAAQAMGSEGRANVDTQSQIGAILQQLAQTRAVAPLSLLGTQATLFGGLPLGLLQGQTQDGTMSGTSTSKTSDPMGAIGGLLAGAGSLATGLGGLGLGFGAAAKASDRRLKRDIVKLGERPDGLGVYFFRYLWSPIQHIGVMAQEVLKVKPEAVLTMPNGFYAVDYGML